MGEQSWWDRRSLSRLDFIKYSLATGVAVWAGSQVGLIGEAEAQQVFGTADVDPPNPGRFPQSVASGDPGPDSIVLWTRVAPGKRDGTTKVGYRVTLDDERDDTPAFLDPLLSGVAETSRERDFTVKVQLRRDELEPFTKYRYRFYHEGERTRTGRFMTLPSPNKSFAEDEEIRFAYVSCQDYTNGYYHALRFLAQEDVDFIVHLGDYIYETVPPPGGSNSFQGGGPEERRFLFPKNGERDDRTEALSLGDYRFAYKKYRTDPDLQAVHENFAFITIWDDHEFANDAYRVYAPDQGGTDESPSKNPGRRQAANRAWAEYTPAGITYRPKLSPLNEIRIYRSFVFGDLLELVMTDERLYRDGPPAGNETQQRYLTPGTGEEEAPGRTMLGAPQRDQFFLEKVTNSSRTWKVWGNEVTFMQFKVANTFVDALFPDDPSFPPVEPAENGEGIYVTLDQWDGFQAERLAITEAVREVTNFVAITGDIHSYLAGYVKPDYDEPAATPGNEPVGVEFVCGSVTSSNLTELGSFGRGRAPTPDGNEFTTATTASNPHIKYFNSDNHGYNLIELTKGSLLCTMVGLSTTDPEANPIRVEDDSQVQRVVIKEFKVDAGEVLIQVRDDAGAFVPLPPA